MSTKQRPSVIYGAVFDPALGTQRPLFTLSKQLWQPATDVFESQECAIIRMEIAGVTAESIKINAQGRRLSISGRRVEPRSSDLLCYHLSEVQYGFFQRVFEFPYSIKMDEIKATYEQGFLTVEVPKRVDLGRAITISIITEDHKEL